MRQKKVLVRDFVGTASQKNGAIKILCIMFDLQYEPDTYIVYDGNVQAIPQTFLNRKVDCWEVKNNTLYIFVLDSELMEDERWRLLHNEQT